MSAARFLDLRLNAKPFVFEAELPMETAVEEVCKMGDLIPVKLLLIDEQGRFKLSRKAALAELNKGEKPEAVAEKK